MANSGSMEGLMDNIKKLSLQGYRISLEGYGSGEVNIRRLSELSVSTVTLDRSLVDEMELAGGEAILRGTIGMLKSVPLEVVATGVDDERTKEKLLDMGCDLLMGELFVLDQD
ncbi:MAG: EAL domain-containing protein [Lachnospiraceae bacterium]|nr:EAL domain-containing protein [Lachnospiraceae bacterium]